MENDALPSEWVETTLGEIAEIHQGVGFPKTLQGHSEGEIPFYKVSDISNAVLTGCIWLRESNNYVSRDQASKIRRELIPEGSVVFAKIGEAVKLNRRSITTRPCLIDNNVAAVNGKCGLDEKFIYYFLSFSDLGALSRATTVPSIRKSDLQGVAFPLPPENEQRRIVTKIEQLLSKLDKGVESLQTARAQLKTYRQSLLKAAFEGRFSRESNHAAWPVEELWNVLDYITSGSRGWAKYYADQGDLFIRAQNLKHDKLDLSDPAYVSLPDKSEGKRTRVERGDLLVTITGANVTKTGLVEMELGNAYVSQHVALCRLNKRLLPAFAYWYLMSEHGGRKQLIKMAYGAGKPGLNLDNIKSVDIPLPGIKSQRETVIAIEQKLAICTKLESTLDVTLQKIEALRQSTLKRAFEGKLVPQDPDDEPASALLERIRQDQADAPEPKRRKRKTKAPA